MRQLNSNTVTSVNLLHKIDQNEAKGFFPHNFVERVQQVDIKKEEEEIKETEQSTITKVQPVKEINQAFQFMPKKKDEKLSVKN